MKYRERLSESKGIDISVFNSGTLEEKSAKAEVMKDCVQNVLFTLGQLANEFPEVVDMLNTRLKEVDLRVPGKPPAGIVMQQQQQQQQQRTRSSNNVDDSLGGAVSGGGGGGGGGGIGGGVRSQQHIQNNNSIVVPQRTFDMEL